ncbi:MAG: hypothetical protein IT449_06825 [Phycisphaerales bacterium]|nr:hypothetical protein [Phycisphaerales bacterium]
MTWLKIGTMQPLAWCVACFLAVGEAPIGEYVGGVDGDRVALRLTESRFTYESRGGAGRAYQGTWTENDGRINLAPVYDEATEPFPKMPVEWRVVDWGARRYLVPEGKLIRFCNAINFGDEPRREASGFALLRTGDWDKPVTGMPQLAPEWKAFLLDRPLTGTVVNFEEGGFAKLSLGGNQGLKAGMALIAHVRGEARCCELKVVCPCEDSARVDIVRREECGMTELSCGDIVIGDEVSTSRSVLNWRKRTAGGIEIVFVPEMSPLPISFEAGAERGAAPGAAQGAAQGAAGGAAQGSASVAGGDGAAFAAAWRQAAPVVAETVTAEDMSRLSRWAPEAGPQEAPPKSWFGSVGLAPIGAAKDGDGVYFGHPVEQGAVLPARRSVHRRLCITVEYDSAAKSVRRVYVTIRGWVEE